MAKLKRPDHISDYGQHARYAESLHDRKEVPYHHMVIARLFGIPSALGHADSVTLILESPRPVSSVTSPSLPAAWPSLHNANPLPIESGVFTAADQPKGSATTSAHVRGVPLTRASYAATECEGTQFTHSHPN